MDKKRKTAPLSKGRYPVTHSVPFIPALDAPSNCCLARRPRLHRQRRGTSDDDEQCAYCSVQCLIFTSFLQIQDTQSAQHTENAEDAGLDRSSSCHGLTLPSLPAEVLFAVIDLLDLPALACFAQTCKDTRAACLTDAVWDRFCDGKGPRHGPHPHKYHKPKPSHSIDIRQAAPHANKTDILPPQRHAATCASACEQQPAAESCTQPQVRYTYLDNSLRLKYSTGLVVDPAWLSLLPKVSGQGSSWLYIKAKTLSGALCAASSSWSLYCALQLDVCLGCPQQCPFMPVGVLCMLHWIPLC